VREFGGTHGLPSVLVCADPTAAAISRGGTVELLRHKLKISFASV
jgi:hypothetical protein